MKRLTLSVMAVLLLALGDSHYFSIKEGNKHYREGNYDDALKLYRGAQVKKDSDVARYNLGNTYYRKKEYSKAAELYSNLPKSEDADLARKGLFNYGNSEYLAGDEKMEKGFDPSAMENFKKAVTSYRKLLLDDPTNIMAKQNLELALRKIKEFEQQKKEQENKENQRQEEKEGDKGKDEQKQAGEDGDEKKQAGQAQNDREKGKEDENSAAQKEHKGKLKPEDVKRILRALARNEEKVQKEIRKKQMTDKSLEKDW